MSGRTLVVLRVVFGLALLPLVTGVLIVTYQDASMTHLPGKWATVEMVRAGVFPFLQPYASFGQPLAGNPNFGTFFPDTLLFLVLPLPVAFGAHFAIAAALGFLGARRWARAEGVAAAPAEVAAFAFVLSGVFLSTWKFYNSGMALAVAPWVLASAARLARADSPRRGALELGLAGALEILAGEPVIALLAFLLAAGRVLAASTHGFARRRLGGLGAGLLLAGLLSAPQLLLTWQIFHGSSREQRPFPFVTATGTSVHPILALEQVMPFPFGRPDLTGPAGFTGHAWFDNHSPYLWTLHLGWATLALLLLFGRPRRGPERGFYAVAVLAAVLSLGKYLPLAKKIYPLLSLDGRIRFPVKWWYVVALCLVPMVGWAAERWHRGERANRGSMEAVAAMLVAFVAVAIAHGAGTGLAWAGIAASTAAVLAMLLVFRGAGVNPAPLILRSRFASPGRRASLGLVAMALALPLALGHLPLLLAVLDRPSPSPPRLTGGRVYERIRDADAHPLGAPVAPEAITREVFRRVAPELWAVSGGLSGVGYAFDRDPDGSYSDGDRAVRKQLEDASWEERADPLRRSGVRYVVTDDALAAPYREAAVLSERHQVRLYALDEPAPAVRLDGGRIVSFEEGPARLTASVETDTGGTLLWSRSYFRAWRASVDGRPVEPVLADGHLVGVPVSAGAHHIEVRWSRGPLFAGVGLWLVGVTAAFFLRRETAG
jgi:hypothetical protein